MRIKVISDLHLDDSGYNGTVEELAQEIADPDVDLLIVAGDVSEQHVTDGALARNIFKELCSRFPQVVYVAGNHEHWLNWAESVGPFLKELEKGFSNLKVLDNEWYEYGGQRFFGGTGWYPTVEETTSLLFRGFSDNRMVRSINLKVWVQEQNELFKKKLLQGLRKGDIVISHHAPHARSIAPQYANNPYNGFFINEMPEEAWLREPALWIHGHTHTAMRYVVKETLVVCNPRGWIHEYTGFDPKTVVEIKENEENELRASIQEVEYRKNPLLGD